jgi:hypothetical protein
MGVEMLVRKKIKNSSNPAHLWRTCDSFACLIARSYLEVKDVVIDAATMLATTICH